MSVQEIKNLLTVPDWQASNNQTKKLLNETFSTYDSLDQLDTVLQQIQLRHEGLQAELSSSNDEIRPVLTEARHSTETQLTTSKELSLIRHSLADEISELSNELVSVLYEGNRQPTLLEDIETLHRSLKELESVKGYVQVIQYAVKLSESAVAQIKDVSTISLPSVSIFQDLQRFAEKVEGMCDSVEDGDGQQKLHIVKFVEKVRDRTWIDMKGILASSLTIAAEKLGWPMPITYGAAAQEDRKAFEKAFANLLSLQTIGKTVGAEMSNQRSEKDGLYPIQALIVPVSLRFKYHFEGNRQTNRLDKPEWYFAHILNVAHEHRQFMDDVIQPLLAKSDYSNIHAWREFALLLLPLLSRKLRKTIPSLLFTPPVLAHTIYQALSFDASYLEEGFQLQGTSAASLTDDASAKWDGISSVILGNQQWFQAWLSGEEKFVQDQYQEIISASDAWIISDDVEIGSQATSLKPTNSARRIKALFEQVTDRYSPLPSSTQRIHFLAKIQLPVLQSYHDRISSSLDAFETLSSAFVRAVPGALSLGGKSENSVNVNTQNLTTGVEGIQRLCKALVSAAYVELALETWAEDLIFLELWSDIHHNPALHEQAKADPLLPKPESPEVEVPNDTTIFEGFISKYTALVIRAENMIVQQVCTEVESVLKSHFAPSKPNLEPPNSDQEILISQTLLAPLSLLSSQLTFLRHSLTQTTFTALYRRIVSQLAEHILHRQILYRGSFGVVEGKRILAESELWVETCTSAIAAIDGRLPGGRQRIEAPWARLIQASRLDALEGDAWNKVLEATFGTHTDEEWQDVMHGATSHSVLSKDVVIGILRRRDDCSP